MRDQEILGIYEAYKKVHQVQEEVEQLDEISQKTATKAYAARATGEFENDTNPSDQTKSGKYKSDVARERIKKKFGKKAAQHADRAAHAQIFGRRGMPSVKEDVYDIILSHLLDEGYAETPEAAEVIMVNMSEEWREEIMEGMTMKDFKANRQKNKRMAASADAKKRGHVGKEWYNSGRRYTPDEAKRSRANLDDEERRTRHRSAVEPDNESDDSFSADKTKNPKKLRKQKAMGEH
jgi:hypothetical protein